MENILGALAGFVIILLILVVAIYVAQAIFLNKFNKLVNGKGGISSYYANAVLGIRPSISLKPNTRSIDGDGTPEDPFIVE